MKTSKKGFSLIELLIVIAIFGIIITLGTSIFIFGSNASTKTNVEYTAQAEMRVAVQKLNNAVRDSSSAFVLYKENGNVKTKGWNYIMLSDDKKSLVEYKWDEKSGQHIKTIIVEPQEGITYKVSFNKDTEPYKDNLISYELERVPESGSSRKISSKVEALNALQVIDRAKEVNKKNGSNRLVANALAYRTDARPGAVSQAKAAVSLVLDTSGSMKEELQNGRSRIYFLKEEAKNLINGLSQNPNINVSLTPFNSTANNDSYSNTNIMKQISIEKSNLISTIDGLKAYGGTNTGDGMRRGFYSISEFNELTVNKNANIKNFMVILVDGETTFASVHKIDNDYISFWDDELKSEYKVIINGVTYSYWYNQLENYSYGWKRYKFYFVNARNKKDYISFWEYELPSNCPITKNEKNYTYIGNRWEIDGWDSGVKFYFVNKEDNNDVYFEKPGRISDNWIVWNDFARGTGYYEEGGYFGDGAEYDICGKTYVDIIGNKIREYQKNTPKAIKVYIIGYAGGASSKCLDDISLATTGEIGNYVTAGNSQALKEIFDAIRFDINDSLWHIGGPQ